MSEEKEQECFSRKYGYSSLKLQVDGMNDDLRMDVWNLVCGIIKETWIFNTDYPFYNEVLDENYKWLWCFFKKNINSLPATGSYINEVDQIFKQLE